jgi:hypothetical protein
MSIQYHKDRDRHTDLAAEVWSKLLDISAGSARMMWLKAKRDAERSRASYSRNKFFEREAPAAQLTGL